MRRPPASAPVRRRAALAMIASLAAAPSLATNLPVLPQWRATAEQVAQAGVPLSELAPNAPDAYTVKRGDTLWGISSLFLRSPWRWPELWGMNLEQIRNPHLIYPGQVLVLERVDGRARLRLAQAVGGEPGTVKLSPRVREEALGDSAIPSIPMHLIAPFLNEAVVFDRDELAAAPRVVAAQEGRVMMSRSENAYVRGEIADLRDWRVFREAVPLVDPTTNEVLGFEARYVGSAQYVRRGEDRPRPDGKVDLVPATFLITSVREEVGIGDRLAAAPTREFASYAPHAPVQQIAGQIVSVYGDGLNAGQNQIVALNRGRADGLEPGHVLALWRDGERVPDGTDPQRPLLKLPDERHGTLFVFRTFDRVSYALILSVREPVRRGDRFTQP
ncbi:MAG: LysM peptidoglycan-binding domain-containing protein [Rubrivivax sp.]|nr:LysM peptidoglycan-binding domain-containing protein [Rubrivivax sp.]